MLKARSHRRTPAAKSTQGILASIIQLPEKQFFELSERSPLLFPHISLN
jgi:hypothetical protein